MSEQVKVTPEVMRKWRSLFADARDFMRSRPRTGRTLIEISAQHPLTTDNQPGHEFSVRLRRGFALHNELQGQGFEVEIYVPGSRHHFEGHDDAVSLSSAGCGFLANLGVPLTSLHGDDLNERYKGDAGVYGSADECFVAARYFADEGFDKLYSVLSPSQMMRKTLHYIAFGVVPLNITAPVDDPYHDYLDELFEAIPTVLAIDNTLQETESSEAHRLRRERKPR